MFINITKKKRESDAHQGGACSRADVVLSPVLTQLCNLRASSVGKRKSEDRSDRWRGGETQHTKRLLSVYGLSGTNEEASAHRLFIRFVEEVSKRKATARLLIAFSSISCYSKNDLRFGFQECQRLVEIVAPPTKC